MICPVISWKLFVRTTDGPLIVRMYAVGVPSRRTTHVDTVWSSFSTEQPAWKEDSGGHERAESARHHHPAGERGLALRGVPDGKPLERRHQARRNTEADQDPGREQGGEVGRLCERGAADHGNAQEGQQYTLRPEAIQGAPQRQLRQGKTHKVSARQQAKIGTVQVHFGAEDRGEGRRDGPQQVRGEGASDAVMMEKGNDVAKAVVDSQDFENRMLKAYIRDWPVEEAGTQSTPN
mgnify:CR=1 FL=1